MTHISLQLMTICADEIFEWQYA